jgi:Chitobiase/beta-hexosaminidase C-terminal domain
MGTTLTTPKNGQTGLERVRFFPGQLLTADDMSVSAEWVLEKLRRHNRYLHGWGIVCGCDVTPPAGADTPWLVHICPGYLVTPQGNEILISSEATFDVAGCVLSSADPCAMARPCPPITRRAAGTSQVVYLAVRYVECDARPVRVAPVGCGCGDAQCDYSRVREAYEFCCLDTPPSSAGQKVYGCDHLCRGDVLACPDCPADGWVVLATITLPASTGTAITMGTNWYADRTLLYSAAMLREMAICSCAPQAPIPTPLPAPPVSDQGTVATPKIYPPSGSYGSGLVVSMDDATQGAEIRYTTNGKDPIKSSTLYNGTFNVDWNPNVKAIVKARAFSGNLKPSGVAEADYDFFNVIQ